MIRETMKNTENSRVYKLLRIRKIVKENGACLYCIKRWKGKVGKLRIIAGSLSVVSIQVKRNSL